MKRQVRRVWVIDSEIGMFGPGFLETKPEALNRMGASLPAFFETRREARTVIAKLGGYAKERKCKAKLAVLQVEHS